MSKGVGPSGPRRVFEQLRQSPEAKPMNYATGQLRKNYFGDRNEYVPRVHGSAELFGCLTWT